MFGAAQVSEDQRAEDGRRIVAKASNKRLNEKDEDTQGQLTEILQG